MSNFVVIHVGVGLKPRVRSWVRRHSNPCEVKVVEHADGWSTWFIAHGIDRCMPGDAFFRGTAITDEGVSFMRSPRNELAWGTFVSVSRIAGGVRIRRDTFGMLQLATTEDAGFSAASDSVIVLASLRRALRVPLSLDAQNLRARSILHLTAAQTMTSATHFQEIAAVPAGTDVDLVFDRVVRRRGTLREAVEPAADYVEAVRDAASGLAASLGGLGAIDGWGIELGMSGGLDSRLTLAAALHADVTPLLRSSRATRGHQRDYEIAVMLSGELGIPFETAGPNSPDRRGDELAAYGSYFASIYDRIGGFSLTPRTVPNLSLDGAGIGAAKGAWGWQSWKELAAKVTSADGHASEATKSAFTRAGRQGLFEAGFDPVADWASENFYAMFRLGVHSSFGTITRGLTGLQVLASPAIAKAGRTWPGGSLVLDLTLLLAPQLTTLKYDEPGRGLTKSEAEARLAELGGHLPRVDAIEVHGSPSDLPIGPSELGLSVARSLGFDGEELQSVLDWFEDDVQRLPSDLQAQYRKIYDNGVWMLGKAGGHVPSAGPSVAKAAGLRVLAALD